MISAPKIFIELLLLVFAFILLRNKEKIKSHTFVLIFAALTLILNAVFYYRAAWPLYVSWGQSQGVSNSDLHSLMWLDIVKWTVLAYFLSKMTIALKDQISGGGFHLLNAEKKYATIVFAGVLGGLLAMIVGYSLSYVEKHLGYLDQVPWPYMKQYFDLGLWGGLRNLAGEEIITRLGAQSILLYYLRKSKWAPLWAIVLSSLCFEFWHNGFRELYFLNFTASFIFGLVYHRYGYESAAISHCIGDWVGLVIVPNLLF